MIDDIRARLETYEQAVDRAHAAVENKLGNSWPLSFSASKAFDELAENAPADIRAMLDQHDADQHAIERAEHERNTCQEDLHKIALEFQVAKKRIAALEEPYIQIIASRFPSKPEKGEYHCRWCGERTWFDDDNEHHDDDCPVLIARAALKGTDDE